MTNAGSASVLVVHATRIAPNPAVNDVILDAAVRHPEVIAACI
nr:hypothetical protein [Candidatus Microthrix sp.]